MTHPLDKPIWSALTSRQAHFAEGDTLALRFPREVSPFIAARDDSAEAIASLVGLIGAVDDVSFLEVAPPFAPSGIAETRADAVQMVARAIASGGKDFPIEPLSDADAPEMLALATLTKPGPFRTRTHTMGRFLGIRDNGRLVAMGGERLAIEGFTELTALCTHPDYRGRGYGAALLRAVCRRILAEGGQPFLHAYAANTGAIALYEHMGFEHRAAAVHAIWKRGL